MLTSNQLVALLEEPRNLARILATVKGPYSLGVVRDAEAGGYALILCLRGKRGRKVRTVLLEGVEVPLIIEGGLEVASPFVPELTQKMASRPRGGAATRRIVRLKPRRRRVRKPTRRPAA